MPNKKVCVIGAGPSGMSFMCWAAKFAREGRKVPEVTCFEKQSDWGGLWNYSWRTGTDENGEPVHGSMYRSVGYCGQWKFTLNFQIFVVQWAQGMPGASPLHLRGSL